MGHSDVFPPCPSCGSTKRSCVRPSGHDASEWHVAREDAMAHACRCEQVCLPWLATRAKAKPQQK